MAIATFQLDPAAASPEDSSFNIRNETGVTLNVNELVFISGWNETQTRPLVSLADANVLGAHAVFVMRAALANNTDGTAFRTFRSAANLNTGGAAVGDPVFLSETAGGFTLTAPTAAGSIRQVIGRVAIVSASVGVIEFDVGNQPIEQIGTNELQNLAVATGKIAATAVSNAKLASTAAQDNLDALSDVNRKYIKTNPVTGEFKVISIHRQADGKLDVEYDDVAV